MNQEIDKIEEIMKPYFEKAKEIEQIENEKNNKQTQRNILNLRLSRLKENKDKEIEEYMKSEYSDNYNSYNGYREMIKNDLEQNYKLAELRLEQELAKLDDQEEKADFTNVYLFEQEDLKEKIRKELISKQKEYENELIQLSKNNDDIMLSLSNFKEEYDDENRVINGSDRRNLFEQSNAIIDKKSEIEKALKLIEKYLEITNYSMLKPLTPVEQEEYNRRNFKIEEELKIEEPELEVIDNEEAKNSDKEESDQIVPVEDSQVLEDGLDDEIQKVDYNILEEEIPKENEQEDIIDTLDKSQVHSIVRDNNAIVNSYEDLLNFVYSDIINGAKEIDSIKLDSSKGKLEPSDRYFSVKSKKNEKYNVDGTVSLSKQKILKLPNGEYVNKQEFLDALDDYSKKSKGRVFTVKQITKNITISNFGISKLRKMLKDCSLIKLIKDKKLSKYDIMRVVGKEKADEYEQQAKEAEIGLTDTQVVPEGEYISKQEVIAKIENIFKEKKTSWLKRIVGNIESSLKDKASSKEQNKGSDVEYYPSQKEPDFIIDDDYIIRQKKTKA